MPVHWTFGVVPTGGFTRAAQLFVGSCRLGTPRGDNHATFIDGGVS